ncbi:MAG: DUF1272 domain-containing protein [Armatimonadota bacterium]
MLKMKKRCERCGAETLPTEPAFICSFECTFCPECAAAMAHVCPNCGGNLVIRPTRTTTPIGALASQILGRLARRD